MHALITDICLNRLDSCRICFSTFQSRLTRQRLQVALPLSKVSTSAPHTCPITDPQCLNNVVFAPGKLLTHDVQCWYVQRHAIALRASSPDCTSPWCYIMSPWAPMLFCPADIAVFTIFPAPAGFPRWHTHFTHVTTRHQTSPRLRTHAMPHQTRWNIHSICVTTPRPRSYVTNYYTFCGVIGVAAWIRYITTSV